jgi:hypothetical protein
MEEVFERLSDMYSIEVQAMPPAPTLHFRATLSFGHLRCSCSASISTAANPTKSSSQDEYTVCRDARADEP